MLNRRHAIAGGSAISALLATFAFTKDLNMTPDLILYNAKLTTLDRTNPNATAVAIAGGVFTAVDTDAEVMKLKGPKTKLIDLKGKRVIPGLNDSHTHLIRGGLNYLMELRWDGVASVAEALDMLKAQVALTPAPQWVRVVGGFTEHQFAEKRLPTLDEINAIAPDTPVFILHLYDRALLNKAALRAVGYDKDTPNPPGGEIQRDSAGNPTGLLIAKPNALILYATLAKGPKLSPADQVISTRHYMKELNRLGITSVIDAGGGFQNYPDDYDTIGTLAKNDQLTVRIAYNLFTQNKGKELEDFQTWTRIVKPGQGDGMYRHNGAGEMLVFSAADFEDFREPRPELAATMEDELYAVTRHLVENRWPFRIHGTYDESISRFLDVFERVNAEVPFDGLHWIIDHAETVSARNIDRIKALGGGIAVQHRMAYQGEAFVARYGAKAAEQTPPVTKVLAAGVPVGMGTDATRVASYNPWVGIYWLVTGKTLGGLQLYGPQSRLDREEVVRLYTEGSAWFSTENGKKGALKVGQYADIAVPNADLMRIPESDIKDLYSVLTIVGGKIVHAQDAFKPLAPAALPISPDWSPVRTFGGYQHKKAEIASLDKISRIACACGTDCKVHGHAHGGAYAANIPASNLRDFWGVLGCACWA
ncbi:amidohydrolase [Asticcacaulis sp. SL142]|uniref:amidohydrolase n=1 Tax=Asticcacaulis sp. SL142 TaxID=2995155 RepID=UPI00226CCD32|nr:amidohydrolase [Asticcacaulis sp. SL142]WAC49667.1 amidohydrolase [Asticcacaulis sp. SL142]